MHPKQKTSRQDRRKWEKVVLEVEFDRRSRQVTTALGWFFFCALTPHPALLLSLGYGSIRALTARSPGPLSLKKKKSSSGGSAADDADWDESEDEVIAAFATSGTPQAGPGGVTSPPPKYAAWLALS